jgi:predicted metallopeptidase
MELLARPALPLELRWESVRRPLPTRWVIPEGRRAPSKPAGAPLDFCGHMHRLCGDIAARCPALNHIRIPRVLLSFTPSRNRSRYGLQARVTPLRFRAGELVRRYRTIEYQVQRFFVDDVEMLYILAFCLPRFFDQSFEEKLSTVFHELFHMSPAFDGDLRRHKGRYAMHSHSKARYEAHMRMLAKNYLNDHDRPEVLEFLRFNYRELWERHGGIRGVVVPRPKLLPVGWVTPQAAKGT